MAIHESLVRNGKGVFRCSPDQDDQSRLLDIPQWMFDRAICCAMHMTDAAGRVTLKGSKYLFLKNWGNLRYEQRIRLDEILAINARLSRVYWLKDLLVHLSGYCRVDYARATLNQ